MNDDPSPTPRESRLLSWIPVGDGYPLILMRIWRRMIVAMVVGPLLLVLAQVLFHFNLFKYGVIGPIAHFLPMIVPQLWTAASAVPIRRAVRECGGHVCVNCLYDLRGQPADAQCPECGQRYLMPTVLAQWKKAYPHLFKSPRT